MKYLVISTIPEDNAEAQDAISDLSAAVPVSEVIFTENMKIHGCIGCNDCWLKTPGICCIKDDYEQIFIKLLQTDRVIFITEAKLGFVSYKMKNLIDRILPIATMYIKFAGGQMRHYSRYKKQIDMGLLFIGDADPKYLNTWMERTALNFHSKSLGAYEMSNRKELCNALNHN